MESFELEPRDEFNQALAARVHPAEWRNPTPAGRYNLVAVGGGSAGLIASLGTAGLGGKAALVERRLLGGDCLNFGCVPSKALLRAARAAYELRHAERFGLAVRGEFHGPDSFTAAMRRMRRLRAEIAEHDAAERFARLGVDVFLGSARFTSPESLEVAGTPLRFARCVLATGGRPALPEIPGLEETGYLTNETVFSLTELPRSLLVLGGGPIGCELAQAFRRFGSEVRLVHTGPRLLRRDDPAAGELLGRRFEQEGIALHLNARAVEFRRGAGGREMVIEQNGRRSTLAGEAVLVATGRAPNLEGLNLEAAGIERDARGLRLDDLLRTTNRRVFAAGDVAGSHQFTHAADAMARLVIRNALFFGRGRLSRLVVPWCTYTDPEVAHVGLTPAQAAEEGMEIDSYREELARVDRAVLDGETEGFAVVHCRKGSGRVVGCTIVAHHAGELIAEIALLMTNRLKLSALGRTIHCYPTQGEVLKRIADQYARTSLTPTTAGWLRRFLAWRR